MPVAARSCSTATRSGGLVSRRLPHAAGPTDAGSRRPDRAGPGFDAARLEEVARSRLGGVTPTLDIPNDIDPATLSRDPSVGAKAAADPLNATTTRPPGSAAEAFAEQARVRRDCLRISVPTLVLHGQDDGLVPTAASAILATVPAVERRTYPELRHELHNEPEGPAIIDEIIAWLRERATVKA